MLNNGVRDMKTAEIWILAVAAAFLAMPQTAAADAADRFLARYGVLLVNDGESKSLSRGPELKTYRVCMTEEPDAVPLKILHDGKETIVEPGACRLIEARNIRIASTGKLGRGMSLIARRRIDKSMGDSQNALAGVRQLPAATQDRPGE